MSNVPLAEKKLKVAAPLDSQQWSSGRCTSSAGAAVLSANGNSRSIPQATLLPSTPHIDGTLSLGIFSSKRSLAVSAACLLQLFIQEAPAWMVSMVVHMLTLVTMAMVTVAEPVPYKPQHLIVTPPEKKKVVEVQEPVEEIQPDTLQEEAIFTSDALQPTEQAEVFIEPNNDPMPSPASVEVTAYGNEPVASNDVLKLNGDTGPSPYAQRHSIHANPTKAIGLGASKASEKSVAKALKWLAIHQMADGGWSFDLTKCPGCKGKCRNSGSYGRARIAATGLALLPFLGTGDTHQQSKHYRTTIFRGLQFLINNMRTSKQRGGALSEPQGTMYSHGIAAIAICEAYGMTKDPNLLDPTREALKYICYAQDPNGGGWRYQPRQRGDTSMVGWQLMALKSGHMAGFEIPVQVTERAGQFLDSVQSNGGAAYGYQTPSKGEATTAIGLLCRMFLGWQHDNPALERGVRTLSKRGPSPSNMYYNYYATQVMRHWEGEPWENWNRQMRDQLVHSQAKQGHEEGSWFTGSGDYGAQTGGRLYCTAMATMILEVYYRHLPIYSAESVEQEFPD